MNFKLYYLLEKGTREKNESTRGGIYAKEIVTFYDENGFG